MIETGKAGRPIKLLIFLHDLAPYGAQRAVLNTVEYLDKKEFSVTVCSFGADTTLAARFSACGAEVVALAAARYLDPAAWRRLFSLLRTLRPDIIQTNMPELSLPVRLLGPFLPGSRVVHTVQNPFSSEPWYWRFLNTSTFFLCAKIIFCSESMKEESGYRGNKYPVVQNGIERALAAAGPGFRKELLIGPGEKVVCCVARLARQKGQDVLLEAAALLASRERGIRVLLAGDGEDLAALKARAEKLGIAGRVHFLGRCSDVGGVLSASDLYAAPSRWEGLGIALGEAMLAGLPCVGTDIAGHRDILKDGVTGLAVPSGDGTALADGIIQLLDNPAEAAKMAAAGRELVQKHFSTERMAQKYEEIYLAVTGRNVR